MSDPQKTKVSAKVLGEFVLLKQKIGSGAFAEVYQGYRKSDKLQVAIKVMNKDRIDSTPRLKQSLEYEIQILRRKEIDHTHIIQLYAVHRSKNHYYLVMDYCAGGDLHKYMAGKALPENVAKKFLCHIAQGLKCLRDLNIVHRDLKPQNLLMTAKSENAIIKIADFGFAREIQPDSLAATFCGSPLYMAPEVLESKGYNAKADLWSIGVILFEMLAGRTPYTANSVIQLLKVIKETTLQVPSSFSPEAVHLIKGLLQVNPEKRMSFEEFFNHPYFHQELRSSMMLAPQPDTLPRLSTSISAERPATETTKHFTTTPPENVIKPVAKPTKVSPFKTEEMAQAQPGNLNSAANQASVNNLTLSTCVTINESGYIHYRDLPDFSHMKMEGESAQQQHIASQLETQAVRAWVIAESGYLHEYYGRFVEASALYIKALQILAAAVSDAKTAGNYQILDQDNQLQVTTTNGTAVPSKIVALLKWVQKCYQSFTQKTSVIKLRSKPADQLGSAHADFILYKYALKLAKESAFSESVSETTKLCITMYKRSKVIMDYLLNNCGYIDDTNDREVLSKFAHSFSKRIELLTKG